MVMTVVDVRKKTQLLAVAMICDAISVNVDSFTAVSAVAMTPL